MWAAERPFELDVLAAESSPTLREILEAFAKGEVGSNWYVLTECRSRRDAAFGKSPVRRNGSLTTGASQTLSDELLGYS
jgi:hypothetical protein